MIADYSTHRIRPFYSLAGELESCAELICQLVYNDQSALPLTKSPTFVNRMKTLL